MPSHSSKLPCVCRVCGATFLRWPSQVGDYCSHACQYSAARTRPAEARKRTRVTCVCAVCGVSFERFPSQAQTYCSLTCRSSTRKIPLAGRFWAKVTKGDRCWHWHGNTLPNGYGVIRSDTSRDTIPATRVAWFLATDAWPAFGALLCHTCDTPGCVRNDDVGTYEVDGVAYPRRGHLWLGTITANARDMVLKGRQRGGPGHAHG